MNRLLVYGLLIFVLAFVAFILYVPSLGINENTAQEVVIPELKRAPVVREAQVDRIELEIADSNEFQGSVRVYGTLPDSCTSISSVQVKRNQFDYTITLQTQRPGDEFCTQVIRQFYEDVSLIEPDGLQKGTYTVTVHGIEDSFTLDRDYN